MPALRNPLEVEPEMRSAPALDSSKLEAILNSAIAAIITIDTAGRMQSVNPATERLFGYGRDEMLGQNVKMLMPEPYRGEHDTYMTSYLATGRKKIIGIGREVLALRKDGSVFPVDLAVSEFEADGRRYFAGIISDLSERKRVEEALLESERKLARAQKLEAIGQLTGGIAHDFNNLLTVIIGNIELLGLHVQEGPQHDLLREAQEAAELGAELTDRLLTFARRRRLEPRTVQLNELVLQTTSLLKRTIGEHISLSALLAPDLWPTRSDPGQIESAIVNLALNARDAMPKGGKLVVETLNVTIDPDDELATPELSPGDYVQLSVSDSGAGMAPEVASRAFEPFFTTKSRGHGTGLGLSMVYGFVKQSGGHATIYSEPGHGTTVKLYLPRADAPEHRPGAREAKTSQGTAGERILMVEDDERVRRLTAKRLRHLGYEVIEAEDGKQAIALMEAGTRFDLVFSDLVMPGGVSGYEVCRRAREIDPKVRTLLTSGYSEEILREEDGAETMPRVLRKPYRQTELDRALREVLDTRKAD